MGWRVIEHGTGEFHLEPKVIKGGKTPFVTLTKIKIREADAPFYSVTVGLRKGPKDFRSLLNATAEKPSGSDLVINTNQFGMSAAEHKEALGLVHAAIAGKEKYLPYMGLITKLASTVTEPVKPEETKPEKKK